MTLIAELQRRKVFKVGAAYLVVAWLAVQAASIAFPTFEAPLWTLRVFILVALLGFPIVLVLTWMIDLTPEGVKLDPDVSGSKRILAAAALLVVLALGWYFYGQPSFRKGDVATPVAASQNSIAVLPFANMSGKPDQEYFSDGMTEELLNVLAKVPQLKVVARTSVFQFKDKGGDVREIGRKLGVSHIVEGSVRRDGQEVRITAQLVRVSDGFHVWSETYDRKLEGVFALQDDIAKRIGDALKLSLGVATRPPIDAGAYDEYLKGRALLRQRKDLTAAVKHFRAAIAKAPDFADAYSSLSLALDVAYYYVPMDRTKALDWQAQAAKAAERAQALAPDAAATEHALANADRARFSYAKAEQHYLRSIAIDSSYADAREDYSELLFLVGRVDDSTQAARQLVALDPYFVVGWMRRYAAAVQRDDRAEVALSLQRIRELSPNNFNSVYGDLDYALSFGRADEARAAARNIEAQRPVEGALLQVLVPWALGDAGADESAARRALKQIEVMEVPYYLVARRDIGGYLDHFAHVGPTEQIYFFADLHTSSSDGDPMLRDPSIKEQLQSLGFADYWREKGWPATCRSLGDSDFECGVGSPGASKPAASMEKAGLPK